MARGLYSGSPEFNVTEFKVKNRTAASGAKVQLFEGSDNGTNKVSVVAPDSLAADYTVTLPSATGTLLVGGAGGSFASSDITGLTTVTAAVGDLVAVADVSDANALKKVTVQTIVDNAEVRATTTNTLTNKTLTAPVISTITNTGTITLPTATCTLVGKDTTDTLTNKTFDANGTGNSISNIQIADLAAGTDGELITWDSSGNPAAVAVGTAGHVLTSNGAGAAPTFQAAAGGSGGGQWEYVSTHTAAGSSPNLDITGLSLGARYKIVVDNLRVATADEIRLRFSVDNGSTFDAGANYDVVTTGYLNTGGGSSADSSIDAYTSILAGVNSHTVDATYGLFAEIFLYTGNSTSTLVRVEPFYKSAGGKYGACVTVGGSKDGTTHSTNAIRLVGQNGTYNLTGTAYLYSLVTS